MRFTIDGREFDPARVDQSARLGTVEEWTIGDTCSMGHPFRLHVWPMRWSWTTAGTSRSRPGAMSSSPRVAR